MITYDRAEDEIINYLLLELKKYSLEPKKIFQDLYNKKNLEKISLLKNQKIIDSNFQKIFENVRKLDELKFYLKNNNQIFSTLEKSLADEKDLDPSVRKFMEIY